MQSLVERLCRWLPALPQRLAAAGAMAAGLALLLSAEAAAQQRTWSRIALKNVESWGYQLQNVVPRVVAKDGFDVLVIDYSGNGTEAGALSREEVASMRPRPGQPERIILAYLSIGEAEDYRYYWQQGWTEKQVDVASVERPTGFLGAPDGRTLGVPDKRKPPARLLPEAPPWLAGENPEWRGNYLVRYWDAAWQNLIFGSPGAYLERIIAAGFAGVYRDKVDANDDWQPTRRTARREMVQFVEAIAVYARALQPGFLIVPQNAEELLVFPDYVRTIDAIAKEDLVFDKGQRRDGGRNTESEILQSKRLLDRARAAGRPVMVVEYLDSPAQIEAARRRIQRYRYIPFFAKRALDAPPQSVKPTPASAETPVRAPLPWP